jgi:hypothetical protein
MYVQFVRRGNNDAEEEKHEATGNFWRGQCRFALERCSHFACLLLYLPPDAAVVLTQLH